MACSSSASAAYPAPAAYWLVHRVYTYKNTRSGWVCFSRYSTLLWRSLAILPVRFLRALPTLRFLLEAYYYPYAYH